MHNYNYWIPLQLKRLMCGLQLILSMVTNYIPTLAVETQHQHAHLLMRVDLCYILQGQVIIILVILCKLDFL